MNASKTEFTNFGSRQQLNMCTTNDILVCGDSIKLKNCIRYLVVFLDDTLYLTFKTISNENAKLQCLAI